MAIHTIGPHPPFFPCLLGYSNLGPSLLQKNFLKGAPCLFFPPFLGHTKPGPIPFYPPFSGPYQTGPHTLFLKKKLDTSTGAPRHPVPMCHAVNFVYTPVKAIDTPVHIVDTPSVNFIDTSVPDPCRAQSKSAGLTAVSYPAYRQSRPAALGVDADHGRLGQTSGADSIDFSTQLEREFGANSRGL